jgi:hypothetical protein
VLNYRCQRGVKRNSDTQMRMLYVLRTLDPEWGGPVEGVRRMSQALIALTNGATSIEIACSDSPNATWHSDWNSPVHALGAGKFGMYGYNAALARWLKSEVKRFDVVVVSGIWMYRSFATSAAAGKAGVSYLIYVHGALDPWFKKYYLVKHLKKTLYWKLIESSVFQDAARVVFTTEEERMLAPPLHWPGCVTRKARSRICMRADLRSPAWILMQLTATGGPSVSIRMI